MGIDFSEKAVVSMSIYVNRALARLSLSRASSLASLALHVQTHPYNASRHHAACAAARRYWLPFWGTRRRCLLSHFSWTVFQISDSQKFFQSSALTFATERERGREQPSYDSTSHLRSASPWEPCWEHVVLSTGSGAPAPTSTPQGVRAMRRVCTPRVPRAVVRRAHCNTCRYPPGSRTRQRGHPCSCAHISTSRSPL